MGATGNRIEILESRNTERLNGFHLRHQRSYLISGVQPAFAIKTADPAFPAETFSDGSIAPNPGEDTSGALIAINLTGPGTVIEGDPWKEAKEKGCRLRKMEADWLPGLSPRDSIVRVLWETGPFTKGTDATHAKRKILWETRTIETNRKIFFDLQGAAIPGGANKKESIFAHTGTMRYVKNIPFSLYANTNKVNSDDFLSWPPESVLFLGFDLKIYHGGNTSYAGETTVVDAAYEATVQFEAMTGESPWREWRPTLGADGNPMPGVMTYYLKYPTTPFESLFNETGFEI